MKNIEKEIQNETNFNSPSGDLGVVRGSFLVTEQPSLHTNLDKKSVGQLLMEMNEEDQKVALAVHKAIPQIEELVEKIVERDMGTYWAYCR